MEKPSTKKPMNVLKTMVFPENFMKYIESNYHESKSEEFKLEIISEDEENYYVRFFPEYQKHYQEGDSITPLRKELTKGEKAIYILKDDGYIEYLLDI